MPRWPQASLLVTRLEVLNRFLSGGSKRTHLSVPLPPVFTLHMPCANKMSVSLPSGGPLAHELHRPPSPFFCQRWLDLS